MAKTRAIREQWYNEKDRSEVAKKLEQKINNIRKKQAGHRSLVVHLMRLYAGCYDVTGDEYTLEDADAPVSFNVPSMAVNTAKSMIATTRTVPMPLPRNGDYRLRRKARRAMDTLMGQFQQLGIFKLGAEAFTDAAVGKLGTTYFAIDPDTGLPYAERCLPLESVVERVDGLYRSPRERFRVRLMDREVLAELYPDHKQQIYAASGPGDMDVHDFFLTRRTDVDQVVVYEGWRLPSGTKANDGRRVLCVSNCVLADKKWERPRFPFADWRYAERQAGFQGVSLVDECRAAQREVADLMDFIQRCQKLGSVPRVLVPQTGLKLNVEMIGNDAMEAIYHDPAGKPSFEVFAATPPDLRAQVDIIVQRVLMQQGLNGAQVSGEKPEGLNSGEALRTYEEVGSRRFTDHIRQAEDYYLQCSQALWDTNDDVVKGKADFAIDRQIRGGFLSTTKWSEVRLDPGEMRLSVFPVSSLVSTPSHRIQQIEDWELQGKISREVAMMLKGIPDTEAFSDLETIHITTAEWQIDKILNEEETDVLPDPHQDPFIAADLANRHYLKAMQDGADDVILDALDRYLMKCRANQKTFTPDKTPGLPTLPMPGGAPPPQPMMPAAAAA